MKKGHGIERDVGRGEAELVGENGGIPYDGPKGERDDFGEGGSPRRAEEEGDGVRTTALLPGGVVDGNS